MMEKLKVTQVNETELTAVDKEAMPNNPGMAIC